MVHLLFLLGSFDLGGGGDTSGLFHQLPAAWEYCVYRVSAENTSSVIGSSTYLPPSFPIIGISGHAGEERQMGPGHSVDLDVR